MTDIADRINALVAHHKPRLGLDTWELEVSVVPVIRHAGGRYQESPALTVPQWKYMLAEMQFSSEKLDGFSDAELEDVVLHELMHVMVSELGTTGKAREERVVTMLTRAFLGRFTKGE